MITLLVLGISVLSVVALSVVFFIETTDRLLTLVDRFREIIKTAALDTIQVRASRDTAALDADRERAKLELSQDYGEARLIEYQNQVDTKRIEAKKSITI